MRIVTFLYVLAEKVSDYHRIFFHSKIPPINKQRRGFLAHVQSDNESHNDEGMHLPEVPRINSWRKEAVYPDYNTDVQSDWMMDQEKEQRSE